MAVTDRSHARGQSYIVCDRKILGGEPAVRGTRISVRSIVLAAREYGGTKGVQTAYPHLDVAAINQALAYYDSHPEQIDRYIRENLADD